MNALGAITTLLLVATILVGPKRWALLAMVAGVLYLTQAQGVTVAGFNLYAFRLLEIAGFVRILFRREHLPTPRNALDVLLVVLYAYTVAIYLARSNEGYAYQIGAAVDAFLCYFVFRTLATGIEDHKWLLRGTVLLLIPYVSLVVVETITFQNPFARIGGVELVRAGDLWVREGRLRATGTFGHPSLLGTFGGTFVPLYVSLLCCGHSRKLGLVGASLCLAIVWAANSGGPWACVAAGALGWALWPMRRSMAVVRTGSVVAVVGLALVMNAPIWYIFGRISAITGGDGFHRSALLDAAFRNLDRWWLNGMPMIDTAQWLPYTNTHTGAVDMTNHFLVFAITAGLGALLLLLALLTQGFRSLGKALAAVRSGEVSGEKEYILWGLGVTISVHLFNWFGISYWDQTNAIWFLHLALVSSLSGQLAGAPDGPMGARRAPPPDPKVRLAKATREATEGQRVTMVAGSHLDAWRADRSRRECAATAPCGGRVGGSVFREVAY